MNVLAVSAMSDLNSIICRISRKAVCSAPCPVQSITRLQRRCDPARAPISAVQINKSPLKGSAPCPAPLCVSPIGRICIQPRTTDTDLGMYAGRGAHCERRKSTSAAYSSKSTLGDPSHRFYSMRFFSIGRGKIRGDGDFLIRDQQSAPLSESRNEYE